MQNGELNQPWKYNREEFLWRWVFLFIFLMVIKEWLFKKMLHFEIPGFNTLSFFGFFAVLLAVGKPHLRWNRSHGLLLIAFSLFTVANHIIVDGEPKRLLDGWFRTAQPALVFGLLYMIDLPRPLIERILLWINRMVMALLIVALFQGVTAGSTEFTRLIRGAPSLYSHELLHSTWLNINLAINLYFFRLNKKKRHIAYASVSFAAVVMTAIRKSFVSSVWIILFFLLLDGSWKERVKKMFLAISGLILYLLLFGQFLLSRAQALTVYANVEAGEQTARTAMTLTSFTIAKNYFPWGSGMGYFASHTAEKYYSPLYYEYGLSNIRGLYPYAGKGVYSNFLSDTYWPHIIGELGFLGTILFLILLFFPLLSLFKLPQSSNKKSVFFFVAAIWGAIFIESTGSNFPEQLQLILVYCGITALLLRQTQQEELE